MKKPAVKGALVLASALCLFCLGLETGGFQFSLLKLAGAFALDSGAMGLLPAAQYAALTLAPVIMGRFSDRIEKKRLYLIGMLSVALGCGLAAQAGSALSLGLGVFLVGWGQGQCGFVNAAMLVEVYPARSGAYMNLTQCFFSLGAVVSPLLTAYCAERFGTSWQLPFILAGAGMLLALACLALADCTPSRAAEQAPVSPKDKAVFSPLRSPSLLLHMAVILLYVSMENGAAYFFDPLFSLEYAAAGYSAYVISAFWLAMFLSRLLFGMLNLSPQKLVLACLLGFTLCLLPPALSHSASWALVACVGVGFLCGPIWPLLINEAPRRHPEHAGAAAAIALGITGLGATIAPALMGLLGSLSNYRQVFLVLAAMGVCALVLWGLYGRKQGETEKGQSQ